LGEDHVLIKVERQVVAGINYRYIFRSEYGEVEAVVYKDLNNDFDIIDIRPVKAKEL
jgi:hypothetical protein